jgi:hypothetical protein
VDDLVTWLRGVLDEDEAEVRDSRMPSGEAPYDEPVWWLPDWLTKAALLADIAAKRAILDLHRKTTEVHHREPFDYLTGEPQSTRVEEASCDSCGWASENPTSACETVRLLASAYKDRPGYRDEWRP